MRVLKLCLMILFLSHSFATYSHSDNLNCETEAIPPVGSGPVSMVSMVMGGMFKSISTLKVDYDGQGSLSVFYNNGKPSLLRLTYKNEKGTFDKTISLDGSAPLVYENPEIPGPAIIVEKIPGASADGLQFELKVRREVRRDLPAGGIFSSFKIDLSTDMNKPTVSHAGKPFKEVLISPGISFFKWDGTFKKVNFK
jgi:hypothetical protein